MDIENAIEQLELAIDLIKQNGKDWLDERDIPMLKKVVEALQKEIIHCKDCRHFDKYLVECMNENGLKHIYSKNDYCKYADKDTK